MRFLDLFSGIGGFRFGMEWAGHECIGFCEIDKFARTSYKAIHDTKGEWERHDITTITDAEFRELRGTVDVICGGFPCQAFSIAGKRRGFQDTRGTLFFHIARAAQQIQPRFLLLENVKGILSHDQGDTFATILTTLDELGYDAEWQVLNSKDFGVPQNRERVFIVGHSRRYSRREVFPIEGECQADDGTAEDTAEIIHDKRQSGETRIYKGICPTVTGYWGMGGGNVPFVKNKGKLQKGDIANCIEANYHKGFDNHGQRTGIAEKPQHIPGPGDINNTLRTGGKGSLSAKHNYEHIHDGCRIRKLTPKECWRLQGFPDWAFHRAKQAGISDSQLYRQAGNSVSVPVIYEIARRMK